MQKLIFVFSLILSTTIFGQELTQTLRGTVIDFDTKTPIIGAKIIVPNSDPFLATISDINGTFKIENVPASRIALSISSLGYQNIYMPSVLIESGKEKVLNIEMITDIKVLNKVTVKAKQDKSESINKMASVSAKTFTVEETNRYSGSFNDPARMVSAFAGVNAGGGFDNNIVVRGNSPRGVLWRLEGIDIPNPNHFSGQGATGGPVNALNGSMLANSDFFSGAFAPEYGNALSGVFDVKFRQGNNEKREYTFSYGLLGVDGTIEGPFKKGYNGSYLANYRYSSLALMSKLGILDFDGIPIYQDASFKVMLPTKKAGMFSLIGLGGMSHIIQSYTNDSTGVIDDVDDYSASLGVLALKHMYIISPKLYVKSFIAGTTASNGGESQFADSTEILYPYYRENFVNNKVKTQSILNYKFNQKNIIQVGATYTFLNYNYLKEYDGDGDHILTKEISSKGNSGLMQSFISWRYRINNNLTVVSGLNYTQLVLNNNKSLEPRLGVRYQLNNRHVLSAGFGLHSRLEDISTYQYSDLQADGSYTFPNKNLGFTKAAHSVVGYSFRLTENLNFKTEVYFQQLYNVPIALDTSSQFSLINYTSGIPSSTLTNKGTGQNYGIELTLERYFANNMYFLATTSLYKSTYTANDGIVRSSKYDANFASNLLMGKEFNIGEKGNKTLGVNTKVSFLGGNLYTPINVEASKEAGYTIRDWDKPYSIKGEDVFILNLGLTYRVNQKRVSHSIKIDVQNLTNNKAKMRSSYFDIDDDKVIYETQMNLIPNLIYTLKF